MSLVSRKIDCLLNANRVLSSTLNLPELLRQIMRFAADVVDAETASLLLYDEKSDELVFNLALNDKESQLKEIRLRPGEGIAGAAAGTRQAQIVNDVTRDGRWARQADDRTSFRTRSVLAVPLLYQERLLGVVEAVNRKNGGFTPEDAVLFEAFAAQAAVAIENARNFERLHEEKEKIEAVFSQMSDGAILVDAAGKKLLVNGAAEQLLGHENTARPALGDILADFDSLPRLSEIVLDPGPSVAAEFFRRKGKPLYLQGIISTIHDSKGSVLGRIVIFRDVTAEKKEHLVKRNFLSLISHKLRTPLVAITGYGPLLLDDPSLSDFQKRAIRSMYRQGAYLASLVDKLIYFTMVENEHLELCREPASLAAVVNKALLSLKTYLEERDAAVELDGDISLLPDLLFDTEKMEAVLRNLIENAVKFNASAKRIVGIRARRAPGYAGVSVWDNGPGIPPEEREKIFQKFYQIEESFTGQVEGAGLGLSLVKRIVESHGGHVELSSTLGEGSVFSVVLPLAEEAGSQ